MKYENGFDIALQKEILLKLKQFYTITEKTG
jgi:hypothetical protein